MTPKLPNELAGWWNSTVKHANYDPLMITVRSHLFEVMTDPKEIEGARKVIAMLYTIAENETPKTAIPKTGIHHEFTPTRKE
jgi:hypothetical protein